jgi:hypothetical protein
MLKFTFTFALKNKANSTGQPNCSPSFFNNFSNKDSFLTGELHGINAA